MFARIAIILWALLLVFDGISRLSCECGKADFWYWVVLFSISFMALVGRMET